MSTLIAAPPAGAATRESLITTAERLFGEFGLEGVSLRMISKEAKCGNVVAVQYHFGDKAGLIEAIFGRRLPKMERMRGDMLRETGDAASLERLVEILFLPLVQTQDEDGRMTFARFLLQFSLRPQYRLQIGHPLPSVYAFHELRAEDGPTAAALVLVGRKLPHLSPLALMSRIAHLLRMFLGALIDREDALAGGLNAWPLDELLSDQMSMITHALEAPLALNDALNRR